nr:F-box/LRR-repeat protein [Ipomoea batatas]
MILGPDSPSVDEPCGGTLRFSGHWILTNVCVTQADILASASSTPARAEASHSGGTLPYRCLFTSHSFGRSLSPVHLRRKSARSVSYYALFQGWLLLGKPPGCLCTPTSFLALSGHLGALAGDPGCFPLDDGAYPPSSHWPTLTPVILGSYLVFRVCLDLVPLSRPAPNSALPLDVQSTAAPQRISGRTS